MKNRYKVVPDLTDIGEPVIKLALFEKEGTEERNRQAYWQSQFARSESFPWNVKVVTSGSLWLDFLFFDAHKGVGMQALSNFVFYRFFLCRSAVLFRSTANHFKKTFSEIAAGTESAFLCNLCYTVLRSQQ